jgi:hypothetical protein
MAPTKYKTTDAQRIQSIVMHACGKSVGEIHKLLGIKPSTFYDLISRAKNRGYEVGGEVTMEMVQDGPVGQRAAAAASATPKKVVKTPVKKGKGKQAVKLEPESDSDMEDEQPAKKGKAKKVTKLEPVSDSDMEDSQPNFKLEPMADEDLDGEV